VRTLADAYPLANFGPYVADYTSRFRHSTKETNLIAFVVAAAALVSLLCTVVALAIPRLRSIHRSGPCNAKELRRVG
jgi:purine-cytosine permease-like protein